jgi:hypothetical protein
VNFSLIVVGTIEVNADEVAITLPFAMFNEPNLASPLNVIVSFKTSSKAEMSANSWFNAAKLSLRVTLDEDTLSVPKIVVIVAILFYFNCFLFFILYINYNTIKPWYTDI